MTAWIIVLSIAAFIGLLLLSPVRLSAEFHGEWKLIARYLFLRFQLAPEKPKKKKKKKQPEKSSKLRDIIKEKGVFGFLSFLLRIAKAAVGWARKLMHHLVIRDCSLIVTVGGQDAAETAMEYGYFCAAVYPAVGAVLSNVKCKRHDIRVLCDFQAAETSIEFYGKFSIRLVFFLSAITHVYFRFMKEELHNQSDNKEEK